ncbi:ABC transporter permease subunit, partial [Acetomicrobium sp. S15 = DSM 107314]|uniref:ABC transporter permease subunit n=1 Tax=Acetomicrobium sp. S15 = DSM 107314 TaxID=2529858 RepID=UPI0031588273
GCAACYFHVLSQDCRTCSSPLLVASQAIPVFALAPLLIVWLGYGVTSKVVMAAGIIFFPITVSLLEEAGVVHRVQGVDGKWRFCAHDPDVHGCPRDHPHILILSCRKMICLLCQNHPHLNVP